MASSAPFPGVPEPTLPATRQELADQVDAERREAELLRAARGSAEKLASATATILAGGGLAALYAGPPQFAGLGGTWEGVAKTLFAIGGLCGVIAGAVATLAAQVTFTKGIVSGQVQRSRDRSEATRVITHLQDARALLVAAVACLTLSVVTMYAAPSERSSLLVRGTLRDGQVLCGEVRKAGGNLVIRSSGRDQLLSTVHRYDAVNAC